MALPQSADEWIDWKVEVAQMKRTSRVFIADRNLLFRRGLSTLFSSDPAFKVAGEADDRSLVVAGLEEQRPNVLAIDASLLEGADGPSFGALVRRTVPGLRILVLAQRDSESSMAAAVTIGAKGLILKSTAPAEMIAALRNVAFEEGGMNASGLLPEFQALKSQLPVNQSSSPLTAREQEVVKLLAEGKTVRMVSKDLALSIKTVEAHKLNLMRKLDIHDRASLIAYANRSGLSTTLSNCN